MNRQKSSGIALIWVLSGIVIVGIVALFIYGIVNRPPNRHIGDNKPWNEKMSQGSADAKNVFIDYTDYFCSFCANHGVNLIDKKNNLAGCVFYFFQNGFQSILKLSAKTSARQKTGNF